MSEIVGHALIGIEDRIFERDSHPITQYEGNIREAIASISEPDRILLRDLNIVVAGSGNAGGNMIMAMILNGIGITGNIFIYDPDSGIEERNVTSGQPYTQEQIGYPKVDAIKQNILTASEHIWGTQPNIHSYQRGMNRDELISHNFPGIPVDHRASAKAAGYPNNIDLIIDGIDIAAPRAIYDLHKEALACGIPVVSGLDLARGFTTLVYDYRIAKARTKPMGGVLTTTVLNQHSLLAGRAHLLEDPESALKNSTYYALLGTVELADLYPSLVLQIINEAGSKNTSQLPATARSLAEGVAYTAVDALINGLNSDTIPQRVRYDLDQETTNPLRYSLLKLLLGGVMGRIIIRTIKNTQKNNLALISQS